MQGIEIIKTEKQKLETITLDVRREQTDSFELVQIETSRGEVECHYYRAERIFL